MKIGLPASIAFALFAGAPLPAPALAQDSSAATTSVGHFTPEEAAAFSKQIERDLAARGARIALVFRSGRHRRALPEYINYTHGALWVHQSIQAPDGSVFPGYVTWNLFHGDGETVPRGESYLATEFPVKFAAGSQVDDVAVIIPTPEMQRRLAGLLASGGYEALHRKTYSLVSDPGDSRFQNCTEFMLDLVAAAAWQTRDIGQIKANLKAHFRPTKVPAGPLARIFGPLADSRLRTADHRGEPIETATFESLSEFMMRHRLADAAYRLDFVRSEPVLVAAHEGGENG